MTIPQRYMPVIKTTDAELRGYENLNDDAKDATLPIFELTKSRRTKKVPYGDIRRRMQRIEEVVGKRPFILDLTTHPDLSNYQIEELQDDSEGFRNWREFLEEYDHLDIFPVVHAYADGELSETSQLARSLSRRFRMVAFRSDYRDQGAARYVQAVLDGVKDPDLVALTLDCGFLGSDHDAEDAAGEALERLGELSPLGHFGAISIAGSGFPKSVLGEGKDHCGRFPMREVTLFNEVEKRAKQSVIYGDYASIHPFRYDIRGGTWVPRVDVPLEREYLYTRYRRGDGGYEKAAREMMDWKEYRSIGSWGDQQIESAAEGHPNGYSPVFWIAVRLNIHVTRKSMSSPEAANEAQSEETDSLA